MKTLLIALLVISCGPGRRDDGGGNGSGSGSGSDDGSCTTCATITGRVWAPKWALGDVPAGQEIPIFGAMIYVTKTRPDPIPQKVYCEACVDAPAGSVLSGHDGSFSLTIQEPGHYFVVIQKGQFRLEEELDLGAGSTALGPPQTTLPSTNDPAHGAYIPKIAIAYGNYDAVGDILAKIGIGTLNGDKNPHMSGTDNGDSTGEVTFYAYGTTGAGSVAALVQNLDEMRKYHIIFFPCSTEVDDTLLASQTVLTNIRRYVSEGGKIYVTDWAGETADRAFPPQLELGDDGFGFGDIDSTGTYDPMALTGTLTKAGSADGSLYSAMDGKAVDPDLNAWMGLQMGPNEDNPGIGMLTPDQFTVVDNWNWISKLNSVMKGTDSNGMPVYDDPKAWVTGSDDGGHGPHPLAVTYEPAGCGKVLYSTFQTSGSSASEDHVGLMPQERVLLFLIMEIDACTQNPIL